MDIKDVGRLMVVTLILIIILFICFIVKIVLDKLYQRSVSQTRLTLFSSIEGKDDGDCCYINISNRSYSNVIVKSFGFKNKLVESNFIGLYKEKNEIREDQNVVIPARESIKLEIKFDDIYKLYEGFKISKIYVYSIDSLGFVRKKGARAIRKQIKIIAKPIYLEKKRELKNQKKLQVKGE